MKVFRLLKLASVITTATASFCLEDESAILMNENDAPSPAPSINFECTSQTSNARGRYASTVAPCTFQFHKAAEDQGEVDLIKFHTSDLCSEDNAFLTIREYVSDWPDECVGDFQRCYSLEHHRNVVWDFFCAKDWQVPEGTTHVSVECRQDKALVLEATTHRREELSREEHESRMESIEVELFNLALVLGACLVALYAISNLIVKPLVSRRDHCTLPTGNNYGCETCEEVHGPISLLVDNNDNHGRDSQTESLGFMEDFDSQVPADFDAVPIALPSEPSMTRRTTSELSSSSDSPSFLTDDFGGASRQREVELVPMVTATTDIPIVAATILHS